MEDIFWRLDACYLNIGSFPKYWDIFNFNAMTLLLLAQTMLLTH